MCNGLCQVALDKSICFGALYSACQAVFGTVYVMVCFYSACQVVLDKSINDSFEYNYEFVIKHVK